MANGSDVIELIADHIESRRLDVLSSRDTLVAMPNDIVRQKLAKRSLDEIKANTPILSNILKENLRVNLNELYAEAIGELNVIASGGVGDQNVATIEFD